MFSKRILAKKEAKNPQSEDYLTEDNKYFFNMLKKQPENLRKKYNLRKKEHLKNSHSELFAAYEGDEVVKSSNFLYRFVESVKQESKKSKVSPKESKISNSEDTSKQGKKNSNSFIWSEFLQTMTFKYAPKPEQNKLKRKFETVKSTTITSDGEHSDDSIIEISSKKVDCKKDVTFLGSKQTNPQKAMQIDQKNMSLELLKKINADMMQENSKFLCPPINYNTSLFGLPNFQNLTGFPLQTNPLQNNMLLQNLRLAMNTMNNNTLLASLTSLPQAINPQLYQMGNFGQFWPNFQSSNSMMQPKMNKPNMMGSPSNYNWNTIMALLQNGSNLPNLNL